MFSGFQVANQVVKNICPLVFKKQFLWNRKHDTTIETQPFEGVFCCPCCNW